MIMDILKLSNRKLRFLAHDAGSFFKSISFEIFKKVFFRCGYMNPDDVKRLRWFLFLRIRLLHSTVPTSEAPPVEEVPIEVKNEKKKRAVEAAKEDAGNYFAKGDYQQAYAIYERVSCIRHSAPSSLSLSHLFLRGC